MAEELAGKKVAILATDGFEQSELTEPRRKLMESGATAEVIAPHSGSIQGMQHHDDIAPVVPGLVEQAALAHGIALPGQAREEADRHAPFV